MQLAITAIAVIAGMVFSLAVALLVEEVIFGQVFRLFFAARAVRVSGEGETAAAQEDARSTCTGHRPSARACRAGTLRRR